MRNVFRRRSMWERAVRQATADTAARRGVVAVVGLLGVSAASAAVTAWREKHEQ